MAFDWGGKGYISDDRRKISFASVFFFQLLSSLFRAVLQRPLCSAICHWDTICHSSDTSDELSNSMYSVLLTGLVTSTRFVTSDTTINYNFLCVQALKGGGGSFGLSRDGTLISASAVPRCW